MNEYLVKTPEGDPLVILEAADLTDAELYAHRNLKGVGSIVDGQPSTEAHEALEESWRHLHPDWTDAQIKIAVGGWAPQPKRIVVPRQLAGGAQEELTEAQRKRQETIGREMLEQSFLGMGFSESAAKIAARGRE